MWSLQVPGQEQLVERKKAIEGVKRQLVYRNLLYNPCCTEAFLEGQYAPKEIVYEELGHKPKEIDGHSDKEQRNVE